MKVAFEATIETVGFVQTSGNRYSQLLKVLCMGVLHDGLHGKLKVVSFVDIHEQFPDNGYNGEFSSDVLTRTQFKCQ